MRKFRLLPHTDWYFARGFLSLFALVLLAFMALLIVADLSQKTDEFTSYAYGREGGTFLAVSLVAQYYFSFAPSMVLRHMMPLVFLLAGMLTMTASSVHNEYSALRSSGVSLPRSILPILAAALVVGYAIELTRDIYLPFLVRKGHAVSTEIKPADAQPLSLVLRDGDEIQSISMGHFDMHENRYVAHNLRIEVRDVKAFFEGSESFRSMTAWEAYLQPRTDVADIAPDDNRELQWQPQANAYESTFGTWSRSTNPWTDAVPTYVTPAMLERQVLGESVMTWADLYRLSNEELDVRMEMHRRRSEPWAYVAILLLGISLGLHLMARGDEPSYVINIVIAVLLCGLFHGLRSVMNGLGETEFLSPFFAAWLPVLLVGGAGGWVARTLGHCR